MEALNGPVGSTTGKEKKVELVLLVRLDKRTRKAVNAARRGVLPTGHAEDCIIRMGFEGFNWFSLRHPGRSHVACRAFLYCSHRRQSFALAVQGKCFVRSFKVAYMKWFECL